MAEPVVCTPLRVEQLALGRRLGRDDGPRVVRSGMGAARSARSAVRLGSAPRVVAGVGGALVPGLRAGDLVVATEVRGTDGTRPVPSAPLLAGALRRLGLPVHLGPVTSTARPVESRATRDALAAEGVLLAEMESAQLLAGSSAYAVVRAVVDTPDRPLLSAGTPGRGLTALRALRAAAPALHDWLAATGEREVVLAGPRSFCAGVERAIDVVERALDRYGAPVYVRRQIVHNAHVVHALEERGAVFVQELDEVPTGAVAVLAAHGVSPAVRAQAEERLLTVIDATCPLVAKVHSEVRRYAGRGDSVFLIGHRDHEEVEGTLGEALTLRGDVLVVEDVETAHTVVPAQADRVAYVMQTTLAVDEAEEIAGVLRERFPSLSAPRRDDICYATTNRQQAVRAVAAETDLVIVVGSPNSSNSRRLVEVAERAGAPAHLVDDASEVDLRWLVGAPRVGITAGASAPPHLVDEVVSALGGLGPVRVREATVIDEDVRFTLPREVS